MKNLFVGRRLWRGEVPVRFLQYHGSEKAVVEPLDEEGNPIDRVTCFLSELSESSKEESAVKKEKTPKAPKVQAKELVDDGVLPLPQENIPPQESIPVE